MRIITIASLSLGLALFAVDSPAQDAEHGADDYKLFKEGLRGVHKDDTYGQQMRPMASILVDDAAIDDVVSYINSLK